ncbi:MAG: DUF4349 domain-containing protein [Gemmatimonadaceae bacterium]
MRWSNGNVVALVSVLTLATCTKGDHPSGRGEEEVVIPQDRSAPRLSAPRVAAFGQAGVTNGEAEPIAVTMADTMSALESDAAPPGAGEPKTAPDTAAAMIIRTGTATLQVDSLERAVVRLRALAQSLGGYVGNTSMQTGKDQLRSGTVEIKVPAPRWAQLLTGLKPIGTLESQNESAEDVGEEFVDVQARVANARRLEQRLIALLENRTGKLSDALAVERELARVREEIDRYEGRIRYLRTRAAVSTMVVTIHEPGPVLGSRPGENPIREAFRDAWRGFIGLIAFLIASLGVVIPLVAIAWAGWLVLRRRTSRNSDAR